MLDMEQKTLFIGSQGDAIHAVSVEGQRKWEYFSTADFDATPVLVERTTLVVGSDDGQLYALNTLDGTVKWKFNAGGAPLVSSAALDPQHQSILLGSSNGKLYALSFQGKLKWSAATGGPICSSPTVDPAGNIIVGSQDDQLYAFNRHGALLWRIPLGGDIDSSVTIGPGSILYVGADDGFLYALK
jgi:outer membrane protein assembly factor BamB